MPGKLDSNANVKWISISSIPKHLQKKTRWKKICKGTKIIPPTPNFNRYLDFYMYHLLLEMGCCFNKHPKTTEKNIPPFKDPSEIIIIRVPEAAWFGSSTSTESNFHKVMPSGNWASARYGKPAWLTATSKNAVFFFAFIQKKTHEQIETRYEEFWGWKIWNMY